VEVVSALSGSASDNTSSPSAGSAGIVCFVPSSPRHSFTASAAHTARESDLRNISDDEHDTVQRVKLRRRRSLPTVAGCSGASVDTELSVVKSKRASWSGVGVKTNTHHLKVLYVRIMNPFRGYM